MSVMTTVEDWLGKENTLGIDIWNKKYRYGNETFDEWLDRVSGKDEEVKKLILEKKFLFGGRILANRGTGDKSSTSNCYVLSVKDNIDSIYETAKDMALTYKAGGGVGVDITPLAPSGAKVNNPAKTSTGAVSFIELFTTTTGLIGQNGRRGALMCSISCDHPDIEEFIKLKTDVNKATTANLSIRVSDAFMNAVKNDEDWYTAFTRPETGECISRVYKAKDLFDKFCMANYDYGEPGLLFWDTAEEYNMLSKYPNFKFAGVNPCFTGDMKLKIVEGDVVKDVPLEELSGRTDVAVVSNTGEISYGNKVWCSGVKDVVLVKTANGQIIRCTPNHVFMLNDGTECMAKDLKGKRLKRFYVSGEFNDKFVKLGFIQGDGQTTRLNSEIHKGIEVNIGQNDKDIFDLFRDEEYTLHDDGRHIYLQGDWKERMQSLGFSAQPLPERIMPTSYNTWTNSQKLSFLRGMYSANGSVVDGHRVQYKTTSERLALELQVALKEQGISSNITKNKPKVVEFSNGTYVCKASYDVCINQIESITIFASQIGFVHKYKNEALDKLISERGDYVVSVTLGEEVPVYDFSENINHWGVVEGFVVHNCAEEMLPDGGACLLGSINLAEFVKDDLSFDFGEFDKAVFTSVRALDKVQDEGINLHPLPIQRMMAFNWRQIGLGIMGLGDMLIKMNIRYGSKESIELCDRIGKHLAVEAIQESMTLGEELGPFQCFNKKYTVSSPFWKAHIKNPDFEYTAMRNSQLLAIAPTGSISTMLGISGGIEPLYSLEYERTTKSLHGEEVTYKVIPPVVEEARKAGIVDGLVCAQDIDYKDRIAMQAIWQKHIDSSISSTINLPSDFPEEEVKNIYMLAWESGCKGITVFRDGCKRAGILNSVKKEESKAKDVDSQSLIGKKRKLMTGCGSLHCTAFFDKETGKFTEIYLSKGSAGGCANFMVGLSRMVSLSARSGCTVDEIIDQLNSCGACPSYAVRKATKGDTSKGSCCPTAVGYALKEMQEEMLAEIGKGSVDVGVKAHPKPNIIQIKNPCPQCGAELAFSNGCNFCPSCGFSKCS